jgi:hypothetical protein
MSKSWACPSCGRTFTQVNQRHACGTGDRSQILRNRPDALVRLYAKIEAFAESLGAVEIVTRDRYALFRSSRIFADLVIMTDAVRLAIHLQRSVEDPIFFKVAASAKAVSHVAKLKTTKDWLSAKPYFEEAYEVSVRDVRKP